jgi:hypothetical protein
LRDGRELDDYLWGIGVEVVMGTPARFENTRIASHVSK